MSLRSEYQNFEFQILNLKFSNTTRVRCAHIYNEKKRKFPTLIFEVEEIKITAAIGVAIQFLKSNIHKHLLFLNITENQKKCT